MRNLDEPSAAMVPLCDPRHDLERLDLARGLRVRPCEFGALDLPCVGDAGRRAVLELHDRVLVWGNRSRVMRIGWLIASMLASLDVHGEPNVHVDVLRVALAAQSRVAWWVAPRACAIRHIDALGRASIGSVSRGGSALGVDVTDLRVNVGDRVDILLHPRHNARVAEVAILSTT